MWRRRSLPQRFDSIDDDASDATTTTTTTTITEVEGHQFDEEDKTGAHTGQTRGLLAKRAQVTSCYTSSFSSSSPSFFLFLNGINPKSVVFEFNYRRLIWHFPTVELNWVGHFVGRNLALAKLDPPTAPPTDYLTTRGQLWHPSISHHFAYQNNPPPILPPTAYPTTHGQVHPSIPHHFAYQNNPPPISPPTGYPTAWLLFHVWNHPPPIEPPYCKGCHP